MSAAVAFSAWSGGVATTTLRSSSSTPTGISVEYASSSAIASYDSDGDTNPERSLTTAPTSGVEGGVFGVIMLSRSQVAQSTTSASDVSAPTFGIFEESSEALEMTTASLSRMDIFVSQTLPILAVVIGAAWVMYTRLDDGINDARVEVKQDLKGVNQLIDNRFNRLDTRLESTDAKLDQKITSLVQQMSDLRVRQTQVDYKETKQ